MRWRSLSLIAILAALLSGCAARAQAVTVEPEMPALDPPAPPPRVVTVAVPEDEEPPPSPPPTTEKPAPPARPPARPARPETKAEPARPDPGKPTAPPGTEVQTETAIRSLLARATRDLSRVNTSALGSDAKAQYETAQRFLQQAEEALKSRNLVFAGKLADKAATLASVFAR
jgi:type IV secretory pathway VirB10-like protein